MKRAYLPRLLKLRPTILGLKVNEFFLLGVVMVFISVLTNNYFITLIVVLPIYISLVLIKKYLQPSFFTFYFKKKEILPYEITRD